MGQDSVRGHEPVMRNERVTRARSQGHFLATKKNKTKKKHHHPRFGWAEVRGTNPFGHWVRAIDGPVPVPDTAFAGAQPTTPSGAPLMRHYACFRASQQQQGQLGQQ